MPASDIPPAAATGFQKGAAEYERGRPSYPDEAVGFLAEVLGLWPGRRVLDLAAGTGKFTRLLLATDADVVALEPVAAMRDAFAAAVPGVEMLDGTAEAIPLPGGSLDAVTVAQAFHWFRPAEAMAEIARVLRPGCGLGLVWNMRDESEPWVAEMSRIIHWDQGTVPGYERAEEVAAKVATSDRFGPLQRGDFAYRQAMDVETLVARVASVSYVAAMEAAERGAILDEMRSLVAGFAEPFALPYTTAVYWCHLLP